MALEASRQLVGGSLEGVAVDSQEFTFRPGNGAPKGEYCFDIGSAGSTLTVLTCVTIAPAPSAGVPGRETAKEPLSADASSNQEDVRLKNVSPGIGPVVAGRNGALVSQGVVGIGVSSGGSTA